MIYEPAEDSFLIENEIKKYSKDKSVLDIGSGSGILALAAKFSKASYVLAADINPEAVSYLKSKSLSTIESDLFSNVSESFDIIVFNPPYLPEDEREDKSSSLITSGGKNGDEIILKFLRQAKKHLNPAGFILIVLSSLTPKDNILNLLKDINMKKEILSKKKIFMETLEVWKITQK